MGDEKQNDSQHFSIQIATINATIAERDKALQSYLITRDTETNRHREQVLASLKEISKQTHETNGRVLVLESDAKEDEASAAKFRQSLDLKFDEAFRRVSDLEKADRDKVVSTQTAVWIATKIGMVLSGLIGIAMWIWDHFFHNKP
jgi:hypothetical protein